ncbi:MAG: TetR/AcrR family transcriptional regulator [Cyanobacteria bacterium QH_2_48_84]|nr:MAG: TetR/AcrR family transcriptional regulator [Cyanobacteria bacterium QH_2_48_84]
MSQEEVITQLTEAFRQYGYEGATLKRLSEATGLGKASLYHHFPKGKEEMAAAVLTRLNYWLEESIFSPLHSRGTPSDRIRAMVKNVDEFYNHGQCSCLLAVLTVGGSNHLFHTQIQKALNLWINSLAQVLVEQGFDLEEARQRAEDAILQIQGALILARGLNDTTPFERIMKRLPEMLLKPNFSAI